MAFVVTSSIIRFRPSPPERTSFWIAMRPSAPGLFSTTKVMPSDFLSSSANTRATISVVPPGANGTIILATLFEFHSCAREGAPASTSEVNATITDVIALMTPLPDSSMWQGPSSRSATDVPAGPQARTAA